MLGLLICPCLELNLPELFQWFETTKQYAATSHKPLVRVERHCSRGGGHSEPVNLGWRELDGRESSLLPYTTTKTQVGG